MNAAPANLTVLITGATGSIGAALANAYAAPGATLLLQGRKLDQLSAITQKCQTMGAEVKTAAFDLRERARLAEWLEEVCKHNLPDLLIVNAGRTPLTVASAARMLISNRASISCQLSPAFSGPP